MRRFIRNNNGSTLLLVIIAMCFIVILSTLILSLTVTNIAMKQVDYESKENFNQTENVINELHTGLEKVSSDSMYQAYNYLLLHYSEIAQDTSKSFKNEFDTQYIKALVKELTGVTYDPTVITPYYYLPEKLKSYLITASNPDDVILYTNTDKTTNTIKINLDITDSKQINSVIVKNIKVKYIDSHGYETTITTDIKLESPDLNFDKVSVYPEFTKYALIADKKLLVQGGIGMNIIGNIYTGSEGIQVDATNVTTPDISTPTGYNLNINGNTLISRGDITVSNYGKLFIGNASTMNIWAENIATGNNTSDYTSYLNINGNVKVADDLMLKAKNSQVIISGNYQGFNFNKTNTIDGDASDRVDSKYSSAILMNGLNSSLDMSAVTSLIVKGRAFISRQSEKDSAVGSGGGNDIMTGESVALKSNQTAYFVPNEYIWCSHNPTTKAELDTMSPGTKEVDLSTAPVSLKNLLTVRGYTEYYYQLSGMTIKYYYLEFKDQQSANTYFSNYVDDSVNKTYLDKNAKNYLVVTGIGVKLSSNLLAAANALTFHNGSTSTIRKPTLGQLSNSNANLSVMLNDSIKTAYEYKALQLGLLPTTNLTVGSGFRFDKNDAPLFQTLIKYNGKETPDPSDDISMIEKEASIGTADGFQDMGGIKVKSIPVTIGSDSCFVDIVYNPGSVFSINSYMGLNPKGILVATGDVNVNTNFEGMIICGGKIMMSNNDVTVKSNPTMVQKIFSYALTMEHTSWLNDSTKKFTHYFNEYSDEAAGKAENIDQVDISQYITYENWAKNAE